MKGFAKERGHFHRHRLKGYVPNLVGVGLRLADYSRKIVDELDPLKPSWQEERTTRE